MTDETKGPVAVLTTTATTTTGWPTDLETSASSHSHNQGLVRQSGPTVSNEKQEQDRKGWRKTCCLNCDFRMIPQREMSPIYKTKPALELANALKNYLVTTCCFRCALSLGTGP